MYSFRTLSKAHVWLLVVAVSLQGFPGMACGCSGSAMPAAAAHGAPDQSPTCCCRQQASVPAEPPAGTHSCCRQADSDVERTRCCCGASCQCKKDDSSPAQEQIPPGHRTQANDLTVGPLVTFCLECSDPEAMETEGQEVTSLSGANRCVLLCRFHL